MRKSNYRFFICCLALVFLSGCVTQKVWDGEPFAAFHEPAMPPDLHLFHSEQKNDVLVQYAEANDNNDVLKLRAYWMEENMARITNRQKPQFVSRKIEPGFTPVPILLSREQAELSAIKGLYAVIQTNGYCFSLYLEREELKSQELPTYQDSSGRLKQIALTPPAVVADTALVLGVLAVACLPALWLGLNEFTH